MIKSCTGKVMQKLSTEELRNHYSQTFDYATRSYNNYIRDNVLKKSWLTANKEDVCDICKMNQDIGSIDLKSLFPSGHLYPPAGQGCRCTLLPVV